MDARSRLALEQLARQAVARDLDQVARELEALRREVSAIRMAAKLPVEPPPARRRQLAAELREMGMSTRAIALAVRADRGTVQRDLRSAGVARPPMIHGLDGRSTRGPSAPGPSGSL
jgi:DNA invertase Pin-like site-specific DNA recombinase